MNLGCVPICPFKNAQGLKDGVIGAGILHKGGCATDIYPVLGFPIHGFRYNRGRSVSTKGCVYFACNRRE